MCSIPGLPTPGSEVRVIITRVNLNPSRGVVELWVNLDDGRKHIYEKMRSEIQTPQIKFSESEGKQGDLCLVCVSDTWHRARIVSVQSDSYNVFLIDQGQPHIATRESLAWGHSESFLLPPETESCILANIFSLENEWSESIRQFLSCLPSKQFKGLVHHVLMPDRIILLEIPILSKYMYKLGATKEVNMDKFKAYVQKCLHAVKGESAEVFGLTQSLDLGCQHDQYLYPELSTGTFEKVTVTGVIDLHYQGTEAEGLLGKTWSNTKSQVANGITCDEPSLDSTDDCEVPYPLLDGIGHISTAVPSEVQKAHDDDVFAVGKSVGVNISCIESLQKFWCQTTEGADSLGHLMQDLQNHYTSAYLHSLVDSLYVAHNPVDGKWYRAKIITSHDSPLVDVRFIDCGQTGKVPLQDVHLLDPAFLKLNAQAFQCCLFNQKNPNNSSTTTWSDAEFTEFQRFVESSKSSGTGLKCVIKGVTSDSDGLKLNVVDIESGSESACKLLDQKQAEFEGPVQVPPQVPSDVYNHSPHNIKVGDTEKVLVTCLESFGHLYCQLCRNSHLIEKIQENVAELVVQPQSSDHPLGLNSICLARYNTDNEWYRGQIVEMAPNLKVHFVDYGDTLVVNEDDICPLSSEASIARSVPVQAVPLGLFNVPTEIHQDVNQWFADHAIGHIFTISVAAKGEKGKLLVELFDGSLNVNVLVREQMSKVHNTRGFIQETEQQFSKSPQQTTLTNKDCSKQDLKVPMKTVEQSKVRSTNGTSPPHNVSVSKTEQVRVVSVAEKTTLGVIVESKESEPETPIENSLLEMTQLSSSGCTEGDASNYKYTWLNISKAITAEVYASCIVGPQYFWCQYSNASELNVVSKLAQEAGQMQEDVVFPEMLEPGSPCLALFPSDKQWYRAQVTQKTDKLHVLFVDYGNESETDISNVKSMPQSLLKIAPQAFLCCLDGFNESKGSWDDKVYDHFYNVSVDKLLKVTVLDKEYNPECTVPQYTVKMECDNVVINDLMQKYWKAFSGECSGNGVAQTETLPQVIPAEDSRNPSSASEENVGTCIAKQQDFQSKMELAYASCVAAPSFFWCQFANTEDLHKVSQLAQEAGQVQQDDIFLQTLGPGSPCLALFSTDNQWYRAQVIGKTDKTFQVLFIDYGNESDVDFNNVRPLPQRLLEMAPQAFLCRLDGFDESKGSWDDNVYEDFYNLLVDKPLRVMVFSVETHPDIRIPQCSVGIESRGVVINTAMQKYWKAVPEECMMTLSPQTEKTENPPQASQEKSHMTQPCIFKDNIGTCMFKEPKISINEMELVYASCIAEPSFFWCQFANTEDLCKVSELAKEAGQAPQDEMFFETLGPGSPCLALFSSDNQWHRAQVIGKTDKTFQVLFIDYGNESDVDFNNVRSLPQRLLEIAPQAFLCRLKGFDVTKGSWDDEAYDDFYTLLMDKPLNVTTFNVEENPETGVPQYEVEVECEGVVVSAVMEKHWKAVDIDGVLLTQRMTTSPAQNLDPTSRDETGTVEEI